MSPEIDTQEVRLNTVDYAQLVSGLFQYAYNEETMDKEAFDEHVLMLPKWVGESSVKPEALLERAVELYEKFIEQDPDSTDHKIMSKATPWCTYDDAKKSIREVLTGILEDRIKFVCA